MNEFLKVVRERRSNEEPVLMITMGKIDKSSSKVRGYRKRADEFVKFY